MLSLLLASVVSQSHSPKIIEINQGKPVPVLRQENVVRPATSRSVKPASATSADSTASNANAGTTVTNTDAPAPKADPAQAEKSEKDKEREEQAKKDLEQRQRDLQKAAQYNDEEWRKAANALTGN